MIQPTVKQRISEHRKAVEAVRTMFGTVADAKIGEAAAPLALVTNAVRIASWNDPRLLTTRERDGLIGALTAAHAAMIKLTSTPAQASTATMGSNALATLLLAWSGDRRWVRGSGPFLVAQKLALAFQLEATATALLDEVAAESQKLATERGQILARMLSAGKLEN